MENLSLTNVMNGGLVELFDRELAEVLRNIADVNTPATAKRRISLEVVFKPFEDRSGAELELKCSSKVVGVAPPKTQIFMGRGSDGKVKAYSRDPRQVELFREEAASGVQ